MKILKKIPVFLISILAAITLTACLPPNYTREEAKAVRETGKEMVTEYLKQNYNTKPSQSIVNVEGMVETPDEYANSSGRYLSMLVKSNFKVDGKEYVIYMNTENGDVYTDYCYDAITDAMTDIMRDIFRGNDIDCKLIAEDVYYSTKVITGGDKPVIATINDAYPATVNGNNVDEYLNGILKETEPKLNMTLNCSGEDDFFTEEAWRNIVESYPVISLLEISNYPDKYIDEAVASGMLPVSAQMWLREEYRVRTGFFKHISREIIKRDNLYVNAASAIHEISMTEDGTDDTRTPCTCKIQVTGDHILIEPDNNEEHRVFFYGDEYKRKSAQVMYSFSDKANKYKFTDCGEGFYTFKAGGTKKVFSFVKKLTVDIK